MRRVLAKILSLMVVAPLALAEGIPQPILDKIVFQVSAKQWVSTQSALLNVNINATLTNADLVKARADIMDRLAKIAKGEWHLLSFERSQDSSGLEKLYVQAQARVNQDALTEVYQNAKSVSIPAAKKEKSKNQFKPHHQQTNTQNTTEREQLYQQVNDEIVRMNKAYPTQNYTVNQLVFVSGDNPPVQPRPYQAKEANTMMLAGVAASAPNLNVSNELTLTAIVEAASNRK